MAHLDIAHLLTSSCGKTNSVVAAESVVETGQEPMARSPSFSQWLRTSILGHLAESKADFELEGSPIDLEESLDLLDEEVVDAQALQEPLQKIDLGNPDEFGADGLQVTILPLESSDLGTDEPQQATVLPLESSDLGTDQPQVAVSTPGLKQHAPISMSGLEETGIVSTPDLGREGLPVDGNELKEPILANNRKDQPKTLDKEPLDEMPWAGFSLFMESRAALQDVSFPRKDSTTESMMDKADEDKSIGITHHPKISQPEFDPVDSLAQRKESKPVLGIMTPLVKNMRGESNAPGLKTKQLSDDGSLERPERKSSLKLPVTPIRRIVSNTPAASIRPAIPSYVPVIPAATPADSIRSAVPATPDASTVPPAEVPASPAMPATPATPPVSAAPAPLSASIPPATSPVSTAPAEVPASPAMPTAP
ncbi:MAG: hypothetical protein KDJ22_00605, partial [Candidatus Competibacteraceae bacterium]|nr:hypothetical protein [Candidatus Competibacteraceae bacterium]